MAAGAIRRRSRRPDDGATPVPACPRPPVLGLGHRTAGGANLRRTGRGRGPAAAAAYAIEWARICLARPPESSEAGVVLAIGYINSRRLQQGKDTLDGVIERSPFDSAPYLHRGIANFGLRDVAGSIADLTAAAERAPEPPEPWTILARIYDRLGDPDAAGQAQARAEGLSLP